MTDHKDEHYFALAARWASTLPANDPHRFSTVVTQPNSPEVRAFLDAWAAAPRRLHTHGKATVKKAASGIEAARGRVR